MKMRRAKRDVDSGRFDGPVDGVLVTVGGRVERLEEVVTSSWKASSVGDAVDLANLMLEPFDGRRRGDRLGGEPSHSLLTRTDECLVVASERPEFLLQEMEFVLDMEARRGS